MSETFLTFQNSRGSLRGVRGKESSENLWTLKIYELSREKYFDFDLSEIRRVPWSFESLRRTTGRLSRLEISSYRHRDSSLFDLLVSFLRVRIFRL